MTQAIQYQQQNVLITGASSGIGLAFAHALAQQGANLILVARSETTLITIRDELVKKYGIKAIVIAADLSCAGEPRPPPPPACQQGFTPTVLINNAGRASYGHFSELSLAQQQSEIMLNCMAVVDMSHATLPAMLANQFGVIVNVASTAAFQPDPYMAIYGATKSFVLSFSGALWAENINHGVRVLGLCPGATNTAFFDVVNAKEALVGKRMSADAVVKLALRAFDQGKNYTITGHANYFLAQLQRFLPRQMVLRLTRKILQPRV